MLTRVPPPFAVSAGGNSVTGSGTVVFSNSNGISFGVNGSTVTASHNAITTARASTDAIGLNTAQTNVTWTVNSSGLSLNAGGYAGTGFTSTTTAGTAVVGTHNTAGLSIGVPNYLTTARGSTDAIGLNTAQSNVTWTVNSSGLSLDARGYAGTGTSATNATITLNSNGLAISVAAPGGGGNFSAGVSTGGNTQGNTGISGTRLVFVGSPNITLSQNTDANGATITFSGGAGAAGNTGFISAGGATASLGTVVFSNSNGVSFGVNGQTVTAAVSSMTISDAATSGTLVRLAFTNLNGVTLSLSTGAGGSHTIVGSHNALTSQSNQNVTAANGGFAFQTLSFSNAQGVSFATSAGSAIVGSVAAGATATGNLGAIQVSDTTYTSGTVTFRNANGISFGSSGAGGVSASYTVPTVTNSSMSVSDAATSGTLARLAFTNLNGVTLSLSTGAGGSHTIVGSHNAITSQSTQFLGMTLGGNTAGTTTFHATNNASLWFNGGNNITLSGNGSTVTISAAAQTNQQMTLFATSNTTQGSSGTSNASSLIFAGAGIASVGITNGSVLISVPSGGGAGDGGVFAGVSTAGNTAGSTGTVSTGNFVLVGSGALTLSQSTGAAGSAATVTFSVPQTSSLSATGWASISVNGSTISIGASTTQNVYAAGNTFGTSSGTVDIRTVSIAGSGGVSVAASNSGWVISSPVHATVSEYEPFGFGVGTMLTNSTLGQNTLYFQPFDVPDDLNAYRINFYVSVATTLSAGNSTGRGGYTLSAALYRRGTGASTERISSFWSGTAGMSITNSSNTQIVVTNLAGILNSTAVSTVGTSISSSNASTYPANSMGGFRVIPIPISSSLTPGRYWLAVANSTTSSNAGVCVLNCSVMQFTSGSNNIAFRPFGVSSAASNVSHPGLYPGLGTYSATSGAFPGSVALSTDVIRAGLVSMTMPAFAISGYTTATNVL